MFCLNLLVFFLGQFSISKGNIFVSNFAREKKLTASN